MAEFIWFFGASGAGKATLIDKVARGLFALEAIANPVVCQESLKFGREQRREQLDTVGALSDELGIRPIVIDNSLDKPRILTTTALTGLTTV